MKHTSIAMAKEVFEKGIQIDSLFWTSKGCKSIHSALFFEHPELGTDSYPAPTLDEWLDYLPREIELEDIIYRLAVMPQPEDMCTVGYMTIEYGLVSWSRISCTAKNPCDAAAEVAMLENANE